MIRGEGKVTLKWANEDYIAKVKDDSFCSSPPSERKMSQTLLEIEKNRLLILESQGRYCSARRRQSSDFVSVTKTVSTPSYVLSPVAMAALLLRSSFQVLLKNLSVFMATVRNGHFVYLWQQVI